MIYIRTIEIHRSKTVAGSNDAIGDVGYSGMGQSTTAPIGETVLFTGIPASIQAGSARARRGSSELPSDSVTNPMWDIYIPLTSLPDGSVNDRDIVVDDHGYRYEVGQAYCNLLGWKLACIRLEA